MVKTLEGALSAKGLSFGIVVSRFNEFFSKKLLDGALDCIVRHGGDEKSVTVAWVPGGFELPMVAKRMAASGKFDAVIALGALIRGNTPHFEYIAAEVAKGLAASALETNLPVAFGVITTDTLEQAIERSGTKAGNKGFDAAMAAIEMANLYKAL
ncbi:MAG: 6,7-dimethyl-8-ribityllumazine synthase [Acidobacteriota bacterium]